MALQYKIYLNDILQDTIEPDWTGVMHWDFPSPLNPATTYSWRVDTYDEDANWQVEGPTWTFTTQPAGSGEPLDSKLIPPLRHDDYDPTEYWDESNEQWISNPLDLDSIGGGRFQRSILAIGYNLAGQGVIYFN